MNFLSEVIRTWKLNLQGHNSYRNEYTSFLIFCNRSKFPFNFDKKFMVLESICSDYVMQIPRHI